MPYLFGLHVPYQNMGHNPTEQGHTGPGRIGSGALVYGLYSLTVRILREEEAHKKSSDSGA